jgi:hypothetical protein
VNKAEYVDALLEGYKKVRNRFFGKGDAQLIKELPEFGFEARSFRSYSQYAEYYKANISPKGTRFLHYVEAVSRNFHYARLRLPEPELSDAMKDSSSSGS